MKSVIKYTLIFIFNLNCGIIFSQYIPLSLEYKLENTSLIVEGKVTSSRSYYDTENEMYTENVIEITKVHKGEFNGAKLSVITMGGTINGQTKV